ncbi:MAG: DUF1810 domain-containing protein [Lachnospiraceae bacterium]|nr:DUF1810 domain-containing protein [Lachnospiraceae bacterium]
MGEGLNRYLSAQEKSYARALQEIRSGKKISHWMWYIFPQIQGLGYSPTAQYYAISGLDEAKEYIRHPVLGEHLREISSALLELESSDAEEVMGWPDNLKLRSSMTLFSIADPGCEVFQKVLDKYFGVEKDPKTIAILGWKNPSIRE